MTQSTSEIIWPPPYTIRKHKLARHVKLRAKDAKLVITIPPRFSLKDIPDILEKNKTWIIKHVSSSPVKQQQELPDHISFHSINDTWTIRYEVCESKCEMLVKPNKEIVLLGKSQNKMLFRKALIAWVKKQSKYYLSVELERLSTLTGLKFNKLTIRDQRTLWGSCNANKTISLNYKLIFLPPRLVRHIIIHELCHTQFLNHSVKFWNKVAEFDLEWRVLRKEMRKADEYIPGWVL